MESKFELIADKDYYHLFEKKNIIIEPAHFHNSIELIICVEGEIDVLIDGKYKKLTKNEGAISDSFNIHYYKGNESCKVYILLGDKKYFTNYFNLTNNEIPSTFFKLSDISSIDKFYNEYNKIKKNKNLLFAGYINLILNEISNENLLTSRNVYNIDCSLICKILKYVDEHYSENLSLSNISLKFGYTREYLSRLIHKYINENWNDYINIKRISIFLKKFNESTSKNKLELMYESGFTSQSTFYRYLKKYNITI